MHKRMTLAVAAGAMVAMSGHGAILGQQPPAAPSPAKAPTAAADPATAKPALKGLGRIRADAAALRPLFKSKLATAFLDAAAKLPSPTPRTLYVNKEARTYLTQDQAEALPKEKRDALTERKVDEELYYTTKYGSPLAYARPLEILGEGVQGVSIADLKGKRVLDYGYGTIGHLRMLAAMGAAPAGVDVDPFLAALYSEPSDQGGLTLVNGRWPAEGAAKEKVAAAGIGGYDLILSKNTLKNGYLHPSRPVDKRMLVDLGVSEADFLKAVFDALKPGGMFMIYNLSPAEAKADEAYKPWADGRCPFSKEQFEKAGFRVLAHDVNDDTAARAMARGLGWDKDGMDVEGDLFAHYTVVVRAAPAEPRP